MAGIGFELKRLLARGTLLSVSRAYCVGAAVSTGPFIFSVATLALIGLIGSQRLEMAEHHLFTAGVVYVYAGAMVVAGAVHVVLTRYLADRLYLGQHDVVGACLFPAMAITAVVQLAVALPVAVRLELSVLGESMLLCLYLTAGATFTAMVFATSVKRHGTILIAFVAGCALATGLCFALPAKLGGAGLLAGFAAGQATALAIIVGALVREFGFAARWDWRVVGHARRYPALVAGGLLMNAAIWVDKVVFWGSDLSVSVHGLVTAPAYDSAAFLGFLTAQPAIVHFFVKLEAQFADSFHRYYDAVFYRCSLGEIEQAAGELRAAVRTCIVEIAQVQGLITLLCAVFASRLLAAAGLPLSQLGILRATIVGSFFLVLILTSNVLLLYLDRRREVLAIGVVFAAANLGFSLWTRELGYQFFGFGFAVAALIGAAVSLFFVAVQLANLEYVTFVGIPISGQKRAGPRLRARPRGGYGTYHPLARDPVA